MMLIEIEKIKMGQLTIDQTADCIQEKINKPPIRTEKRMCKQKLSTI